MAEEIKKAKKKIAEIEGLLEQVSSSIYLSVYRSPASLQDKGKTKELEDQFEKMKAEVNEMQERLSSGTSGRLSFQSNHSDHRIIQIVKSLKQIIQIS